VVVAVLVAALEAQVVLGVEVQAALLLLALRLRQIRVAGEVVVRALVELLAVQAAQASSSSLTPALPSKWLVAR